MKGGLTKMQKQKQKFDFLMAYHIVKNFLMMNKNKKGQFGLNLAIGFVAGLITLVAMMIVGVIIYNSLGSANILPAGSLGQNLTNSIVVNGSQATSSLAGSFVTWFAILSLVVLIIIIGTAVIVIKGFGRSRGGG